MDSRRHIALARGLNLLVPGTGLVLVGCFWPGLTIGAAFAALTHCTIAATMLFPDEFAGWMRPGIMGAGAAAYLGGQAYLSFELRRRLRTARRAARREALAVATAHLHSADAARAWEALAPLLAEAEHDLLVAYRVAQVVTMKRDVPASIAAWQRVRELDRHRVYRRETDAHLRHLNREAPPRSP